MDEIANIRHDPAPALGRFSGVRAQRRHARERGAEAWRSSYEHIDPAAVGNSRRVLVSDLAGRSNIVMKAQELGFKLDNDTPELEDDSRRAIKELEHEGYRIRSGRRLRWRC